MQKVLDKLGKNQQWLADKLKVSQATVSHWCTGASIPRKKIWDDLATVLQISRSELALIIFELKGGCNK